MARIPEFHGGAADDQVRIVMSTNQLRHVAPKGSFLQPKTWLGEDPNTWYTDVKLHLLDQIATRNKFHSLILWLAK